MACSTAKDPGSTGSTSDVLEQRGLNLAGAAVSGARLLMMVNNG